MKFMQAGKLVAFLYLCFGAVYTSADRMLGKGKGRKGGCSTNGQKCSDRKPCCEDSDENYEAVCYYGKCGKRFVGTLPPCVEGLGSPCDYSCCGDAKCVGGVLEQKTCQSCIPDDGVCDPAGLEQCCGYEFGCFESLNPDEPGVYRCYLSWW